MFMKNKILVWLLAISSSFIVFGNTFADLKVSEKKWSSLQLSWDKDWKSSYYQVFYWEKSASAWKQSLETEATESTNIKVSGLKEGTKYYFNLVWLDDSWVEVYKSPELEVVTDSASSSVWETFSVTSAKLISEKVLRLWFSKNLDKKSLDKIEVKIESASNSSEQIGLKDATFVDSDSKKVDLELWDTPEKWTEYKVVVLVIYDENWNNIKYWVDSEAKFVWWEINVEKVTNKTEAPSSENLNSAWPVEDKKVEETKVEETVKTEKKVLTWISWTAENSWKNVEKISEKKEDLPKTWPEMFFILLLAMMFSAWILYIKNKKA